MVRHHREIELLVAAYALGALDGEDLACVEEHLPTCRDCRLELEGYERVADALAVSVEPVPTPEHLRSRVLGAVRQQRAAPEAAAPGRARRRLLVPLLAAYAVAASAAAVVLGVPVAERDPAPEGPTRARPRDTPTAALVGVDDTAAVRGRLSGAEVVLARDGDRAALVVTGAPEAPVGRVWQVWLIPRVPGKARRSAGVIPSGARTAVFTADAGAAQAMAVTLEPAPGSSRPTSTPAAYAEL